MHANAHGPVTSSIQWNLVMNSAGFSLRKDWVGVGSVWIEIAAAEAKSEERTFEERARACEHSSNDESGEQSLYKPLSGMVR